MITRQMAEEEIYNELLKYFEIKSTEHSEGIDLDFIANCSKISAFLMDKESCIKHLKKLSLLIQGIKNKTDDSEVNILRDLLENELSKYGFKPLFAKVIAELKPEEFRSLVKEKYLLKDIALDGTVKHGEFTHAIQWLLICWEATDNPAFVSQNVSDIFQQFGEMKSVYQPQLRGGKEKNMWDLVVDKVLSKDFRSPEFLMTYIENTNEKELTTLKRILKLRWEKRFNEQEYGPEWLEKHSKNIEIGKHTIFKRDQSHPNILLPVERKKPKKTYKN